MASPVLNLLLMSTPVGPLGSGLGGGVELTLTNLCQELGQRGQRLTVLAPAGSRLPDVTSPQVTIQPVMGALQSTAHTQTRDCEVRLPGDGVLPAMWDYARRQQQQYDLIVNFAYDWLPFYLTPFFAQPVAHFVTMGSLTTAMDRAIAAVADQFPGRIGVYTQTQAETFLPGTACEVLGSAIDLSRYRFCPDPGAALAWMGRISPEKGLEDAIAAADITGCPLKIMGKIENPDYWQQIQQQYPNAPIEYLGFLATDQLQAVLGQCRALVMTPRWVEAFGNVAIEALACGVPVIAYRRGGPSEIIRQGETGWLVEPDSVAGLVSAIGNIDPLDRWACRRQAEQAYSLAALGDRFEQWFQAILGRSAKTVPC